MQRKQRYCFQSTWKLQQLFCNTMIVYVTQQLQRRKVYFGLQFQRVSVHHDREVMAESLSHGGRSLLLTLSTCCIPLVIYATPPHLLNVPRHTTGQRASYTQESLRHFFRYKAQQKPVSQKVARFDSQTSNFPFLALYQLRNGEGRVIRTAVETPKRTHSWETSPTCSPQDLKNIKNVLNGPM